INFIACCSRPDISNAVRTLASHASNPSKRAWIQLNNLAKYLKTTRDWVLTLGLSVPYSFKSFQNMLNGKQPQELFTVFADSDYAGESTDRVSVAGYVSMMSG